MKKDDFVKLGVDESLATELEKASMEELKGFIPKARFDEVNNEKKKLESDVKDRDKQLEDLKSSTSNIDDLKSQISKLQAENKAKDEAHAAEVKELRINAAVEAALVSAKAKNITATKALIKDLDKAELLDDGTIKGLDEQIKTLKSSDDSKFLFDTDTKSAKPKGVTPSDPGDDKPEKPLNEMSYTELAKYMEDHPDVKID